MATASTVGGQTGDSIAGTLAQVGVSAPIAPRASLSAAHGLRIDAPPVLDGWTDDPAWARAQVIDYFLEYEPQEGAEPQFRAEARVTDDDPYLHVLARMHDPAPDSI